MVGFAIVMVFLIICATILMERYMYYCSENGVKMFQNPRYDDRIRELEKQMKELRKE